MKKRTAMGAFLFLCANTYFDTICVHPLKSAYTLSKMRTVKLTDKLEFVKYLHNSICHRQVVQFVR